MIDTQYGITIMGGREVSRPYRFFSPKARGFLCFLFRCPPVFIHRTNKRGTLLIAPKHAEGMSLRYGEIVNFDTLSHKKSLVMEAFFVDIFLCFRICNRLRVLRLCSLPKLRR